MSDERYVRTMTVRESSLTPTVLVTIFFGFFGIIPVLIASHNARLLEISSAKYWITYIVILVIYYGILIGMVSGQ